MPSPSEAAPGILTSNAWNREVADDTVVYDGPIVTRAEAKATGLVRYFTGKPCKHGHVAQRTTGNGECFVCAALRQATFREANPEATKATQKRHRTKFREERNAYCRDWYLKNRESVVERTQKNAERRKETLQRWRREDPLRQIAQATRRRARMLGATGQFTAEDVAAIRKRQKDRCAECKARKKLSVDHIIPLSKGGTNDPRNLQLLCHSCNSRKHNVDPIEWARRNNRLV